MAFLSRLFGQANLIYVHTDKQQYYAGDHVSGQIILSVIQPLHIDAIYLKLYGHEEVEFDVTRSKQVKDQSEKTTIEYYKERVRADNTFFRKKYCIYAQKCTFAPGNFVFPFQSLLGAKLPGTFEIYNDRRHSQSVRANIIYRVEAEVAVSGTVKPKLHHGQDILICEPSKATSILDDTYKETKITCWCCIPRGAISISAKIDKNAYEPGETIQLRVIVDNSQSQLDLGHLSFKLVSDIKICAGTDTYTFHGTVANAKSAGVKAGERVDRYLKLTLSDDLEPSTSSSLIECKYILSVELELPWTPNMIVNQPVQIYAPPKPAYVAQLPYPIGWAPSIFSVAELQTMQYVIY